MFEKPTCWYEVTDRKVYNRFLKEAKEYYPEFLVTQERDNVRFWVFDTDIGQRVAHLNYRDGNYILIDKESPFERYLLRKGAVKRVEPFQARVLDAASGIRSDHKHDAGIEPRPLPKLEERWYQVIDYRAWNRELKKVWERDFQMTLWSGHTDISQVEEKGYSSRAVWHHFEEINGEHGFVYVKAVKMSGDDLLPDVFVRFTQDSPLKTKLLSALRLATNHDSHIADLVSRRRLMDFNLAA